MKRLYLFSLSRENARRGTHVMRRSSLAAVLSAIVLAACGQGSDQSTPQSAENAPTTAPSAPPPSPDELAQQERPPDQVALEQLYKAVNDSEEPSGNPINDKTNFMRAYQAFCSRMQRNGELRNWTGRVHGIYPADPTSDISKKPSISLDTPGGLQVFQELDEDSTLYKTVLALKEGDYVRFSLNVTHVEQDTGTFYDECHDPDYDSPKGPLVNTMLSGELTQLAPLS